MAPFRSGEQEKSNREGFLYWNGDKVYGVKWQHFQLVLIEQKYLTDPALPLGFPHIVSLVTDPKGREPFNPVYLHTWTMAHFGRLMKEFELSAGREQLIPAGAPLDYVPKAQGDRRGQTGPRSPAAAAAPGPPRRPGRGGMRH